MGMSMLTARVIKNMPRIKAMMRNVDNDMNTSSCSQAKGHHSTRAGAAVQRA
jgi:hypothetical protein